jgi:hypothetical protein
MKMKNAMENKRRSYAEALKAGSSLQKRKMEIERERFDFYVQIKGFFKEPRVCILS